MTALEIVNELYAELERRRSVIDQHLAAVYSLRADLEAEVAGEPSSQNACDECDRSFGTAHGLSVHKARSHADVILRFDPERARAAAADAI